MRHISGNSIQGPLSKRPDSKCPDSKGPGLKTSKIQTFFKSSLFRACIIKMVNSSSHRPCLCYCFFKSSFYSVKHKGLSSISFCT